MGFPDTLLSGRTPAFGENRKATRPFPLFPSGTTLNECLYFFVIVIGFVLKTSAFGQNATSSATAQASIVQPIDLSKVRDLSFGNISAGGNSGTVVLDPTAPSTRTASGGVTLPSGSGTVQSAKFIVSGIDGWAYSIILPLAAITLSDGKHFMTADNFTSIPSDSGLLVVKYRKF